jgi:hypothetical protein
MVNCVKLITLLGNLIKNYLIQNDILFFKQLIYEYF